MDAALLDPDSPRWIELLSHLPHDFYHLPRYVAFAAEWQDPGRPVAFVAEEGGNRLLLPLIIRPLPAELQDGGRHLFDATGPRGYPGLVVSLAAEGADNDFLDRAIAELGSTLQGEHVVSAFVRLHPLLLPPMAPLERAGTLVNHGWSTSIDLSLPRDVLWAQTNHGHRSGIKKAQRLGYVARVDESWARLDGLADLYRQSMTRLGADAFWHLSTAYFQAIRDALGSHLALIVVEQDDQLAAAGLFTEVDGIVEYHLSGTADQNLRDSPSKLLIDAARWWAKDRGDSYLHLAGSLRPDDSLAAFKAGFSPTRNPVWSWRLVTDAAAYALLQRRWESTNLTPSDDASGFFPSFRKKVSSI